jgi:hypothetical protein
LSIKEPNLRIEVPIRRPDVPRIPRRKSNVRFGSRIIPLDHSRPSPAHCSELGPWGAKGLDRKSLTRNILDRAEAVKTTIP